LAVQEFSAPVTYLTCRMEDVAHKNYCPHCMNVEIQMSTENLPTSITIDAMPPQQAVEIEKVLCPHCQRTATNGVKCRGVCVADHS
jgi:hypothetical protein